MKIRKQRVGLVAISDNKKFKSFESKHLRLIYGPALKLRASAHFIAL